MRLDLKLHAQLRPAVAHSLKKEHKHDRYGDGDDDETERYDDCSRPQTKYGVNLVFDPLQQDRVSRSTFMGKNGEQKHQTRRLIAVP